MRFLYFYGVLTSNIVTAINYPPILNTRFINPLFSNLENSKLNYGSEERRRFKEKAGIRFLVQDHHCIPKQYRNHRLLQQINFNVNCCRNILIMPTRHGIKELNLHPDTRFHEGGHSQYNKYVGKILQQIYIEEKNKEAKQYQMWLFLHYLKDNLIFKNNKIPWD